MSFLGWQRLTKPEVGFNDLPGDWFPKINPLNHNWQIEDRIAKLEALVDSLLERLGELEEEIVRER